MMTTALTAFDLDQARDNAVIYSDAAWAVARKGVGVSDWFVDPGASARERLTAQELISWAQDWERLR